MSGFPKDTNPSQRQAINHTGSHLLIVAGPGTGKTHTLTHRIEKVAQNLSSHQRILAITFTNKAAQEMRARLMTRMTNVAERVTIGTFHQLCLSILQEYIQKTNLSDDFRIASPEEIEQICKNLWPDVKSAERKLILVKISQWKAKDFGREVPQEVMVYNKKLRENGLLDFDDLLLETLYLLKTDEEVLSQVRKVYRDIFVDEYQDINAAQHVLLKTLVGPENRITAIGDPNQAIYGFRGSDIKYFETFIQDFNGAVILSLTDNYRSTQNLISAAGQVMANYQVMKVPELTAKIIAQGRLTIHEAATDRGEAEYVVHTIEKMIGGTSMFSQDSGRVGHEEIDVQSFGDIAVLYRLNSQRLALQEAFDRSGIPYQTSADQPSNNPEEYIDHFFVKRCDEAEVSAERVSLMTLHAAKGLEFPSVFIVGCEQDILPLHLENLTSNKEEERRLFYVGMTRAKERLFLVRAKRRLLYGKTYHHAPSVFLADIEEGLKEYEQAAQRTNQRNNGEDQQLSLF